MPGRARVGYEQSAVAERAKHDEKPDPRPLNDVFATLGTDLGTKRADTVSNRCDAAK